MAEGIEFDDNATIELLDRIYRMPLMVERRHLIRDKLALAPGESVLSIGTGPGFEAQALAEAVGPSGRVFGIDTEAVMLKLTRERCANQPWVTVEPGDATVLPVDDGAFDAATAVQVYEYVPNLDDGFDELYRALRPGGRAAVYDSDWSTLTWNVADEERSERLLKAFDAHCPHPRIARTLKPRLERAGFEVTSQDVFVHFDTELNEETSTTGEAMKLVQQFLTGQDDIDTADVEAWVDDIHGRARSGEYFSSFNQYLFVAEKPA